MRVTSNSFPTTLIGNLQRLTARMNTLQQQTATGQRITNPSDDPTAVSRVLNYGSEKSRVAQYYRNAQRASDIISATTAQVQNMLKTSDRANEITTLASDVQGPDALHAYGTEIDGLLEQTLVNANSRFDGEPLFGGTTGNAEAFTAVRDANGQITSVSYTGSTDTADIQVAENSQFSPYSSYNQNQQVLQFLNNLVALRDSLQTGQAANVKAQSAALQSSESDLVNAISSQGALQQRLDVEMTQNSSRYTNLDQQISREADADLAQAVVLLTQNQNAYQAALMSAGKILGTSLLDYL